MRRTSGAAPVLLFVLAACGPAEPAPLPPNSFAFAVFGDGPYALTEVRRFRRVSADINRADVAWLVHVGDIFGSRCTNRTYAIRLHAIQSIGHPVIYTPGDNEWTDCHAHFPRGHAPLERLSYVRENFFPDPDQSLGARPMALESQSRDTAFAEFVENARWRRGGFLFLTVHIVGSANATDPFRGRTAADDAEVERRTAAAVAWMDEGFELATSRGMKGVVLALHGNPDLEPEDEPYRLPRPPYEPFLDALAAHVRAFPGEVLLIHGDWHEYLVDSPVIDRHTREALPNLTRLQTFGSPDIGWVRVVVDSVAGRVVAFEPRVTRRWQVW